MKYIRGFYWVVAILFFIGAFSNVINNQFDGWQALFVAQMIAGLVLIEDKK